MLDDTTREDKPEKPGKARLTPKAPPPPVPVCTLMSDGSVALEDEQKRIPLLELNRLLLSASAVITERTAQRAAAMESVLGVVQARFDGFDPQTEKAMATVLGQVPAEAVQTG
jgi:hypothetical protein